MKQSIIIVGAGAAGLVAANELAAAFDVTVLEASERTGGRIHSFVQDENIIEAGPEFIHGNLPVTLKLLKKAGIDYLPVKGKTYRKEDGSLVAEEEMLPHWDALLKKMKKLKKDISLKEFLETYFSGDTNKIFRDRITGYAGGFDLADSSKASTKSLYKEWKAESEDNYRIPAGYKTLTTWLEKKAKKKGCKIIFNKTARKIHWEQNDITLYTDNGERFQANKLLITTPISMMQHQPGNALLQFDPSIDEYHAAADNIGFGTVVKIGLKFKHIFWKADTGFILSDEKYFPTWWTKLPGITAFLTGWMGGPAAETVSTWSEENIIEEALLTLASIFNKPVDELKDELVFAKVFNWKKNRHALGAYSYDTIHSEKAKKIMRKPIADTIYFAGEALYSGDHPGTVEAALVDGRDMSKLIKKSL